MLGYFIARFWYLGPASKAVAVIAALFAAGWILGTLGMHTVARQLGSAALFILGLLLTVLVIRRIWTNFTGKPGTR